MGAIILTFSNFKGGTGKTTNSTMSGIEFARRGKNKAESLASIGLFKSQKAAIDAALDMFIDSLPPDDKRRFNLQMSTLEERDVRFKK